MKNIVLVADFETVTYDGIENTEVWAAACVKLFTEKVSVWNNINDFMDFILSQKTNVKVYFHNLGFDGWFILNYLLCNPEWQESPLIDNKFVGSSQLRDHQYKYLVSDTGKWFSITLKIANRIIEILDSYKLIPFSVKAIGSKFQTKHKKSTIEYKGKRKAYGDITDEEKHYIANDVLVVKEALELLYKDGHRKMTIGSCCLSEYKKIISIKEFSFLFPNLEELQAPYFETASKYVRRSYGGGWCFYVSAKAGKILKNGFTADVNSLYPFQMHSSSGNYYPTGYPEFLTPEQVMNRTKEDGYYYFIHFKCNFIIKDGYLPFIHIRNSILYNANENLKTNLKGPYHSKYAVLDGEKIDLIAEFVMTETEFDLFQEHYNLFDLEIISGVRFVAEIGLFDKYIDKYNEKKENAQNEGERTESKLFNNNLYGKFATRPEADFKQATLEDGIIKMLTIKGGKKAAGYIPIGSAITAYARAYTIRAAQANYYGEDQPGFVYADTDSIHCDMPLEQIKGLEIDSKKLGRWKIESEWDIGYFVRQKTYIEIEKKTDSAELNREDKILIRCAGMPDTSKELFIDSLTGSLRLDKNYTEEEIEFVEVKRTLEDFKPGLKVPGKLLPKRIKGGIVLQDTFFTMKKGL